MIVLDASVMIAILDREDAHFDAAKRLFDENAAERLAAHRLTFAEALVQAVRTGRGKAVAAGLAALGVELVDVLDDPLDLAEVRVESNLKVPDSCVLLAAIRARASIATFDRGLAESAHRFGVDVVTA